MNQTRKITTETWVREFTEPTMGVIVGQATFYPERGEFYPPHMILKEQDMHELLNFLLECIETFQAPIETNYDRLNTERNPYDRPD